MVFWMAEIEMSPKELSDDEYKHFSANRDAVEKRQEKRAPLINRTAWVGIASGVISFACFFGGSLYLANFLLSIIS